MHPFFLLQPLPLRSPWLEVPSLGLLSGSPQSAWPAAGEPSGQGRSPRGQHNPKQQIIQRPFIWGRLRRLFLLWPFLPNLASLRHVLKGACFFGTHGGEGAQGDARCAVSPYSPGMVERLRVGNCADLAPANSSPRKWAECVTQQDLVQKASHPHGGSKPVQQMLRMPCPRALDLLVTVPDSQLPAPAAFYLSVSAPKSLSLPTWEARGPRDEHRPSPTTVVLSSACWGGYTRSSSLTLGRCNSEAHLCSGPGSPWGLSCRKTPALTGRVHSLPLLTTSHPPF